MRAEKCGVDLGLAKLVRRGMALDGLERALGLRLRPRGERRGHGDRRRGRECRRRASPPGPPDAAVAGVRSSRPHGPRRRAHGRPRNSSAGSVTPGMSQSQSNEAVDEPGRTPRTARPRARARARADRAHRADAAPGRSSERRHAQGAPRRARSRRGTAAGTCAAGARRAVVAVLAVGHRERARPPALQRPVRPGARRLRPPDPAVAGVRRGEPAGSKKPVAAGRAEVVPGVRDSAGQPAVGRRHAQEDGHGGQRRQAGQRRPICVFGGARRRTGPRRAASPQPGTISRPTMLPASTSPSTIPSGGRALHRAGRDRGKPSAPGG